MLKLPPNRRVYNCLKIQTMKKIFTLIFIAVAVTKSSFAILTPIVDSVTMSDGKKLAADIYIPSGMATGPVILIQTPYNRLAFRFGLPLGIDLNLNSSNYIFVVTDWRGFYGSAGALTASPPSRGVDGKSTVDWIAAQPWCNGKIGTWGPSALGKVQFQTAKENPAALTCICPLVAGPQFDYDEYFPNGVCRTEFIEQLDGLGFGLSPILMANPVFNPTWTFAENANFYPTAIQVPCFMIGGWYDHNIEVMLPFFNAIRTSSPASVKNQHRLLMGPWAHGGNGTAYVGSPAQGQLLYSNAGGWNDSLALMFFDYHMRAIPNGWNTTDYVQYYQMGENTWNTSPNWPVAAATPVDFQFHPGEVLSPLTTSSSTASMSYNYDPNDPSPTYGGPTLRQDLDQGPFDQSDSVESRSDILTFTTIALTQNAVLKGSPVVHMKVSSNRLDTDFDIRLTDVYPDGRSMLVNDGAFRMRFRDGLTAADTSNMTPGTIYDCVIPLPNTAITFLAGHKIRVDVSSSNYPRFNRNMNTGGPMYPGNSMDSLVSPLIATNTIYTNDVNKSYITLPLEGWSMGIDETEASKVNIYPNPCTNFVLIEHSGNENVELVIYNMLGEKLVQTTFEKSIKINSEKFAKGIYFAELRYNEKVVTKKIVKQ